MKTKKILNRHDRRKAKIEGNIYEITFNDKKTKKVIGKVRWCTYEMITKENVDKVMARFKVDGKVVSKKEFDYSYKLIQGKR